MTRPDKFKLSIVIPVHNEAECLPKLLSELEHHVPALTSDYEIIFVDDASSDNTFTAVRELAQTNSHIKSLSLSRNMGHQAALACGLEAATGDTVITMDGDLQHPPSVIPELVAKWREGYDVVNTSRRESEGSGFADGLFSKIFYFIFNKTSRYPLTPAGADFRLLDRKCVDALSTMTEHFKFFRGMVSYIGFPQTTVAFDCPPRFAGTRSYTFVKSLRLASDGLLSFSTVGLALPLFVGGLIIAVVLGYFVVSTILILTGVTRLEHGWASIVALIFLSIGLQFTFLGMFGLYIGKIFIEVKRRPAYFVRETVGFK
jgi:dolichol-phosphate mannosyltransferase